MLFFIYLLFFNLSPTWSYSVSSFDCDFSGASLCKFYDISTTARYWTSQNKKGPTTDDTGDGYFAYTQNEGIPGNTAFEMILQLDFNFSIYTTNCSFAYEMSDPDSGTLEVLTSFDYLTFNDGNFKVSGQQSADWRRVSVMLPEATVAIQLVSSHCYLYVVLS